MPDEPYYVDADGHLVEHPTGIQEYAPHGVPRPRVARRDRRRRRRVGRDGRRARARERVRGGGGRRLLRRGEAAGVDRADALLRDPRWRVRHEGAPRRDGRGRHRRVGPLSRRCCSASSATPIATSRSPTCRAYNDWLADHCAESNGRLYGAAVVPQWDAELAAAEIRRAGAIAVPSSPAFLRPNPTIDWKPLSDPAYDPIWQAACDAEPRDRLPPAARRRHARARAAGCASTSSRFDTPWMRGEMDLKPPMPGARDGLRQPLLRAGDRRTPST